MQRENMAPGKRQEIENMGGLMSLYKWPPDKFLQCMMMCFVGVCLMFSDVLGCSLAIFSHYPWSWPPAAMGPTESWEDSYLGTEPD